MALEFAHGAVQWLAADGATTVYTISGLPFQPKALRFYWMGLGSSTDAASEATHSRRGMGFASGTGDQRCLATQDQDAVASSTCTAGYRTDCVAMTVTSTPAVDGRLRLDSITSDGFTLEVDDAVPVDVTVFWEAWGGSDITVATTLEISEPSATGAQDYTVTGFTSTDSDDQVVMFCGGQGVNAAPTVARRDSGFMVGFGAGTAASENVVVVGNVDDAFGTADADKYGINGKCIAMIALGGGDPSALANISNFLTDGFRLNWTARATTGRKYIALAIKGGNWRVGETTIGGAIGNTTSISGLPFTPFGLSLISMDASESTVGVSSADDRIQLGTGSSPTSRRSMGHLSENGPTVMEVNLAIDYDAVLVACDGSGGTYGQVDIDAMLSDGWRLIRDVAGTSQWIGYLTFGNVAAAFPPAGIYINFAPTRAASW